eukprot:TCONS_00069478-protein
MEESDYQFKDENEEEITMVRRSDHYSSDNIPASEKPRWPVAGKKRGRPSCKGADAKEWMDIEIFKLVELWEKKDILYNTKHLMYYNKEERDNAVKYIQKALSENDMHATIEQITDKMTNLKCYYGSQKRNMENMKLNGGDGNYISPWKFFNHLQFLNGHFLQRTPTTRRRYIVNHHQHDGPVNYKLTNGTNGKPMVKKEGHLHQFPYESTPNPAKITMVDPYIIHQPKASMVDPYAKPYPDSPTVTIKPYKGHDSGYWDEPPHKVIGRSSPPYTNGVADRKKAGTPPHAPGSRPSSTGSPRSESNSPKMKLKSEDDCFSELICKMLNQIPESEEKAMLRLEMQQKVIALRYRS